MTKWFAGICVLVAGCWISSVVMAQEKPVAVDPSGTWRWEYELNGESMKDSLKLNIDKDNKVVGIYQGRSEKTIEIKDGKMEGDSLSFYFSLIAYFFFSSEKKIYYFRKTQSCKYKTKSHCSHGFARTCLL